MRRPASVRVRITLAAVVVVGFALAIGGTGLVIAHRASLMQGIENAARLRSRDVAATITAGHLTTGMISAKGDDNFVQVVDSTGTVIAASPNIEGEPRISHLRPGSAGTAVRTVSRLPDGDSRALVLARRVTSNGSHYTIYVAASLETAEASSADLVRLLLIGLPALLLLVGATTWILTGRALRPVETIRAEVEAIGAEGLDRRVLEPDTGDEIARLAHTMNGMLARLEASNDRQQRFVADASHELRSPLAGIRAQLEVNLAYPDRGDRGEIDRDMLADTIRLQRLVDDLLALSSMDAPQLGSARRVPVDLDVIVLREARRLRGRTTHRVDATAVSGAQVTGDPDQLTQAVRNLLDNAARHASSIIMLTLEETEPGARFSVSDDGPGIPPDAQQEIFERFTRLDNARVRDVGGTGLGLAITRAIITDHGGSITVDNVPGARFTVTLPS